MMLMLITETPEEGGRKAGSLVATKGLGTIREAAFTILNMSW